MRVKWTQIQYLIMKGSHIGFAGTRIWLDIDWYNQILPIGTYKSSQVSTLYSLSVPN